MLNFSNFTIKAVALWLRLKHKTNKRNLNNVLLGRPQATYKPLDVFYKVIYNIYSIAYNTLIRAYKSLYKLYGCCFVGACCILFCWALQSFYKCSYTTIHFLIFVCVVRTFIFPTTFPKDFLYFFVLVLWIICKKSTAEIHFVFVLVAQN